MSGGTRLENANPVIFQRSGERLLTASEEDEDVHDPIDDREIFDILFSSSAVVSTAFTCEKCTLANSIDTQRRC